MNSGSSFFNLFGKVRAQQESAIGVDLSRGLGGVTLPPGVAEQAPALEKLGETKEGQWCRLGLAMLVKAIEVFVERPGDEQAADNVISALDSVTCAVSLMHCIARDPEDETLHRDNVRRRVKNLLEP